MVRNDVYRQTLNVERELLELQIRRQLTRNALLELDIAQVIDFDDTRQLETQAPVVNAQYPRCADFIEGQRFEQGCFWCRRC